MKQPILLTALVGLLGTAVAISPAIAQTSGSKSGNAKPAVAASKPKPVKPAAASKPRQVKSKSGATPVAKTTTKPAPAVATPGAPVADKDLAGIYAGKTWVWPEGAAYFAPDGKFVAWSGKSTKASFARGSWRTRPNGRLCFYAQWVSRAGAGPAETCFSHLAQSGVLMQRKEPDGEWYVFKHGETRADDEFSKLVTGDQAGAEADKIRETFRRG